MFNFNRPSNPADISEDIHNIAFDAEKYQEGQRELTNDATRRTMELMEKYDNPEGPGNIDKYEGYYIAQEARNQAGQDAKAAESDHSSSEAAD